MLASAVRTYLNRYGVAAGTRVVVATTNDSVYAMLPELAAAGVEVATVADARPTLSDGGPRRPGRRGRGDPDRDGGRHRRRSARHLGAGQRHRRDRRPGRSRRPRSPAISSPCRAAGARSCTCTASGRASCAGTTPWSRSCRPARSRVSRSSAPPAAASPSRRAWPTAPGPAPSPRSPPGSSPRAARTPCRSPTEDPQPAGTTQPLWVVRGPRRRPRRTRLPLRRPAAGPDRRRRAPGHRRRHAQRRAHQAVHLDQHGQRPGQDVGGQRDRRDRGRAQRLKRCDWRRPRGSVRPPTGRRTRRSPSPRWPDGTGATCSTRPGSPPSIPGTSPPAPSSRSSASGCGRGTTRRTASRWTRPCCGSAPPSGPRSG